MRWRPSYIEQYQLNTIESKSWSHGHTIRRRRDCRSISDRRARFDANDDGSAGVLLRFRRIGSIGIAAESNDDKDIISDIMVGSSKDMSDSALVTSNKS